jgi:transketolase
MDRIIDISYRLGISHIGSSLTTYPILEDIYNNKNPEDIVVLSAGHAGLAHYVILEKMYGYNAEEIYNKHGTHPHRDVDNGILVSSGSLGSAILVATGIAFASPHKQVHCIISDGECAEGSVWEALAFSHINNLTNFHVHVNINGYSAYDTIDTKYLSERLLSFNPRVKIWYTTSPNIPCMTGLKAHYHVLNENEKNDILRIIS